MDLQEARTKAERFANTAFNAATENLVKESHQQIAEMKNKLAARGMIMSGLMFQQTAKIHGERIKKMVQARLDAFLEGYELHNVPLDEQLTNTLINDLLGLQSLWAQQAGRVLPLPAGTMPANLDQAYVQMVNTESMVSMNSLKVQIERRRLMPKKTESNQTRVTNVYHITGESARVNMNSTDNSVNIVSTSTNEIFTTMRAEITSHVPAEQQKEILAKLEALEQAQNSPTFGQRYSEFIATAANHMNLIAPFIPALTEVLHKTLP